MNTKKILFVTLIRIDDINQSGIYTDLISKFISEGYKVTVICPIERRVGLKSRIINSNGAKIIQVKSLNIQKTNFIEKTISTFFLEFLFLFSFLKNCKKEKYDVAIFTTPPIFMTNFLSFLNNKYVKMKYLLLKDIFPQNAIDLKITNRFSPFYVYSRIIEKKLYEKFDYIGCMSIANKEYILRKNPLIKSKLEVNPNTINVLNYPSKKSVNKKNRELNLVYGGNIGKPQNPVLILNFIKKVELLENINFKIIGSGTEFKFLKTSIKNLKIKKTKMLGNVSKKDYFNELNSAHVGLIFLDENFTIPNFPSRLLDYLYFDLFIISNTDKNTDIVDFINNNNIGKCFYGLSDLDEMVKELRLIQKNFKYYKSISSNSYSALTNNFDINRSFDLISNKLK